VEDYAGSRCLVSATTRVFNFWVRYKHSNTEVMSIFSDLAVSNWTVLLHRFFYQCLLCKENFANSSNNNGYSPSGYFLHSAKSWDESIDGGIRDRGFTENKRADVLLLRQDQKTRTLQN